MESLFPQKDLVGPWKILGEQFMHGIFDAPVLYSDCVDGSNWIEPKRSLLMHDDNDTRLYKMLAMDKLPLVLLASEDLKKMLLRLQVCRNTTTPSILRRYFSNRKELLTAGGAAATQAASRSRPIGMYPDGCLRPLRPSA